MKRTACKNCALADKEVPTGLRILSPDTARREYTGIEHLNKCVMDCAPRFLNVGARFYPEMAGWGGAAVILSLVHQIPSVRLDCSQI